MRTTGYGLSAVLIAIGAILAWAVTYQAEGVDLNQVGIIVLFVGIGLGVLTMLTNLAGSRTTVETQSEAIVDGHPVVERQRNVVAER